MSSSEAAQRGQFHLAGCLVKWQSPSDALAARFERACAANLIALDAGEAVGGTLTVELLPHPPIVPSGCSELSMTPRLQVLKGADESVHVCFDDCLAVIAPGQQSAGFWMSDAFELRPLKEQQIRLSLLMVWLLQSQGITALHGATLVRDGRAIVLTAVSGAGKSTTALTLADAGWGLCADDISLLDCRGPTPRIWPLARGISAAEGVAQASPGWQLLDATVITGKQLLQRHQGGDYQPAPLSALFFPRVVAEQPSAVLAVRGAEALLSLLPGIGGILTGLPSAEGRLQELAQLCSALPCYELQLGHDVYRQPAALSALINTVLPSTRRPDYR